MALIDKWKDTRLMEYFITNKTHKPLQLINKSDTYFFCLTYTKDGLN